MTTYQFEGAEQLPIPDRVRQTLLEMHKSLTGSPATCSRRMQLLSIASELEELQRICGRAKAFPAKSNIESLYQLIQDSLDEGSTAQIDLNHIADCIRSILDEEWERLLRTHPHLVL